MKAKKEVQEIQGTKQEFLKVFREMCYSRSAWQVWADLISMIACSLANSTDPDKAGVRYLEREREAKKQMEETKRALEEILGENKDVQNAFQVKGKGLLLVVPASAEDIRAEGAALHHCVGTYVDRVARGETNIFFIRKEKEPDKPYFTMEWRDNDIVQCRGSRNCGMPPEVKAFTEAFKKKMLETIEKDKGKGLRRCG